MMCCVRNVRASDSSLLARGGVNQSAPESCVGLILKNIEPVIEQGYHWTAMIDERATCPLCERVLWPGWSVAIILPGQDAELWVHSKCARRHLKTRIRLQRLADGLSVAESGVTVL